MVERFEMGVDVIVCRQAINYWWSRTRVRKISRMLRDRESRFVFNTFGDPPPERMQVRRYEHDGAQFIELIERWGDRVYHLQYRSMVGAHFTVFRWIDPCILDEDLGESFAHHTVATRGNTRIYTAWEANG